MQDVLTLGTNRQLDHPFLLSQVVMETNEFSLKRLERSTSLKIE